DVARHHVMEALQTGGIEGCHTGTTLRPAQTHRPSRVHYPQFMRRQHHPCKGLAMGQGISEVLTFAIGVAISPIPIIAVIVMLFSQRARVNGPVFLLGWVVALAVVSGVVYVISDQSNAATSTSAADSISWGKIVLGALFLLLAARQGRNPPGPRPAPAQATREG